MQIFLMDLRLFLRDNWAFAGALVMLFALGLCYMFGTPAGVRYVLGGLFAVFTLIFLVKGSLRPVVDKDGNQLSVKDVREDDGNT